MINGVMLATRNYKGLCEENFITTLDEFINEYCSDEDPVYLENLKELVETGTPFEWSATYYLKNDESFDLRMCQGEDDLLLFLGGEFNSSIDELENSNPGSNYGDWYWDNRSDLFTPRAIGEVMRSMTDSVDGKEFKSDLFEVMPDFPLNQPRSRLADLISAAEKSTQRVPEHFSNVTHDRAEVALGEIR